MKEKKNSGCIIFFFFFNIFCRMDTAERIEEREEPCPLQKFYKTVESEATSTQTSFDHFPCNNYDYRLQKEKKKKKERFLQRVDT